METNFFTNIIKLIPEGGDLNFSFRRTNQQLTVSILPKYNVQDHAKDIIQPIIISGNVEELNEQFFTAISAPIVKTNNFLSRLQEFEKSLEKAEAESKLMKAKQEEEKKKKEGIDKIIQKVDLLMKEKDFERALKELEEAKSILPTYEKLLNKIEEVKKEKAQKAQVSLF